MNVLMIVQGEGRGHMTQAVSMAGLLQGSDFNVVACMIGTASGSHISSLLTDGLTCPIIPFDSPNLIYNKKSLQLDIKRTIFNAIRRSGRYFSNLNQINRTVKAYNIDLIINFYDVLGGLYNICVNQNRIPFVSVAHQYLLMHPDFPHPKGSSFSRNLVNLNSRLTSAGATLRLALSFSAFDNYDKRRIVAVPPLIRKEVIALKSLDPSSSSGILAYCTQQSMIDKLITIKENKLDLDFHLFSSRDQLNHVEQDKLGIYYHKIDPSTFLDVMQSCTALVTTAGFESICEAMYLGKPVVMIPLFNHYEQTCNAIDAQRIGAGMSASQLSGDILDKVIEDYQANEVYGEWVLSAKEQFLAILSDVTTEKIIKRKPIKKTGNMLLKYSLLPVRKGLGFIYQQA